jgi:hypothetical protein
MERILVESPQSLRAILDGLLEALRRDGKPARRNLAAGRGTGRRRIEFVCGFVGTGILARGGAEGLKFVNG